MSPYEWWTRMCAEYDEAEKEHTEALARVTAQMRPGASGAPRSEDLDVWERARDRVDAIRAEMDDFIRRQFPER
jgi:hypothetical protein